MANEIEITPKFISLEKIIASKNKTLLKILPKPLLKWFKKLIHLDEINAFIYNNRDKQGVDFANALIEYLNLKIEIVNPENIPVNGRPLLVANHPIGSMDGISLISIVGEHRKDILFPVNDILCYLPGLKGIFVPINKYGRNSQNHSVLNEAFQGDSVMMFFPAGTESKIIDGKLQDFAWKKSFVKQAQTYQRDIVPVYIEGQNSKGFYRFSKVRRFFGIKFDLEMILLPREMFMMKNKTLRFTFGKPIPIAKIDKSKKALEWAGEIRKHVYRLKDEKDAEF